MTPAIEELSDCALSVAGLMAAMPMSRAMTSRRETPGRVAANLVNFKGVDLLGVDDVACIFDTRASWRERKSRLSWSVRGRLPGERRRVGRKIC